MKMYAIRQVYIYWFFLVGFCQGKLLYNKLLNCIFCLEGKTRLLNNWIEQFDMTDAPSYDFAQLKKIEN